MFTLDQKIVHRLEPGLRRVIVADPNAASSRLLADIVKSLGAREVFVECDEQRVMDLAREVEPGLIITERTGPRLDGEALAKRVRRSTMSCRMAPIIMVTAEATASTIKGARDAGVHEFLRKPFTSTDLFRRVENVLLKPRDWVEAVAYVGPDRRRFNSGEYAGPRKRKADAPKTAAETLLAAKDQALRILASALAQFDTDPTQAVRAVRQQAETLKTLALKTSDARLALAAGSLETCVATGRASKNDLAGPINALLAISAPTPDTQAG
ncbi:MAG TPA: response regulator [Brevundimonas sp.]|uniref:response regulator n=1 Tax=Brevundimonas sp. TaxID=1871086 RepID=UPI0026148DA3|nr:response regulator [Brevundimonas sp.]HRO31956.1 response regulator [Brevundimonas sp.]